MNRVSGHSRSIGRCKSDYFCIVFWKNAHRYSTSSGYRGKIISVLPFCQSGVKFLNTFKVPFCIWQGVAAAREPSSRRQHWRIVGRQ